MPSSPGEAETIMRTVPLDQSVAMIPDGASLMIGGFMAVGTPERLIDEIVRQKKCDLTVIANDTAQPGKGIGKLVEAKLLRKAIVSHIGLNPERQLRTAISALRWTVRVIYWKRRCAPISRSSRRSLLTIWAT